jgi:Glycosyl transferase family 2
VRNEGDVIEEFVRHNLRFLDGLTVVDHASVDGTLAVLHALAAEGLPLTVVSDPAPLKLQSETMTQWSHRLLEERAWDFLFLLDADEFLKVPSREALIASLAAAPRATHCLLPWSSYVATAGDDASAPDVLRRIRFRRLHEAEPVVRKAVVSRDAVRGTEFRVAEGSHSIETAHGAAAAAVLNGVRLAHFPVRSVAQIQAKVLVGWGGYLALGYDENAYGWHQERLFRELESSGRWTDHDLQRIATLYCDPGRSGPADLVDDPMPPVDGVRYRDAAVTGALQVAARYVRQLAEIIADGERPGASSLPRKALFA